MPGSPLLARQNSSNYIIIFAALLVILLLLVIYLIHKAVGKIHSSPQWLEAHKNLPTTKRNIENVAKEAGLTNDEKAYFAHICRKFKLPNVEYLIKDEEAINEVFKKQYKDLANRENAEEKKALVFSTRYKIERSRNNSLIITSTKSILAGQEFLYVDDRGSNWTFTLIENNPQGLFFSIPSTFANSTLKPQQLSKLNLTFVSKSGIAYLLTLRIIRYEMSKDGSPLLIASHTNTLKAMQRRNAKRMVCDRQCKFSAVEVTSTQKGKTKEISYEPKQNKYEGKLQDISAMGCQINCTLPIQQGQYIYVEFSLDDKTINSAIGLIVQTTQTHDGTHYILHIKFIGIDIAVKNSIEALICNYA